MILRKNVSLAPLLEDPGSLANPDDHFIAQKEQDAKLYKNTGTRWIRIWADWYHMQPKSANGIDTTLLTALDADIAAAKRAGLGIILISRSYPLWANGTSSLVINGGANSDGTETTDETDQWITRQQNPNAPPPPCAFALQTDRPKLAAATNPVDQLRFRFPVLGTACSGGASGGSPLNYIWNLHPASSIVATDGSDWYNWILFLASRYANTGGVKSLLGPLSALVPGPADPANTWIDGLEFVNEPLGSEGWPQTAPDPTTDAYSLQYGSVLAVAQMFHTAQVIQQRDLAGGGPLMLGPASEDRLHLQDRRTTSTTQDFTYSLLKALAGNKFDLRRTSKFVWTHHCYDDFTHMRTTPPRAAELGGPLPISVRTGVNSAALVRAMLVKYGWQGYTSARFGETGHAPRLRLTEGGVMLGAKISGGRTIGQQEQAKRLKYIWEVMRREKLKKSDPDYIGTGISMYTNWLFYQVVGSLETGLRNPVTVKKETGTSGGSARPAYNTWKILTEKKVDTPPPAKPS